MQASSALRHLAFLAPGIVLPPLLDRIYPALTTLTQVRVCVCVCVCACARALVRAHPCVRACVRARLRARMCVLACVRPRLSRRRLPPL